MSAGFSGQPFEVTFFQNFAAASMTSEHYTLDALASRVRTITASDKQKLPWLKCARFGSIRTDKGSLRHDNNVLRISGLEGDYDGEKVSVSDAVEILTKAGVISMVYTSPSHTSATPRWRVICPTSCPQPPERRGKLLGRLNGLLGGILSSESWTLSQAYYYGSVNYNPDHEVHVIDGSPIDEHDELDEIWLGKPATTTKTTSTGERFSGAVDEAALLEDIATGASYHTAALRLLGKWAKAGVPYMDARQRLLDAFDSVFPPDRDARWKARRADVDRCLDAIYVKEARKLDEGRRPEDGSSSDGHGENPSATDDTAELILSPGTPLLSAREFLRLNHTEAEMRTLHHQNATFYSWAPAQTHYTELVKEEIQARLYNFLDKARQPTQKPGVTAPFSPAKSKVSNVLEALAAAAQLPYASKPPSWLDAEKHPPATELVSCNNGLLHLPTRELLPHTPAFFTLNALEFAYQHDASPPTVWLEFQNQLWPGDKQSIEMVQEMFGLVLTGDTSHQKAFLLVGPKRSGKGTIARVVTKLLGQANVCGPTLSGLGETFGLAPLIGKRLAIISDARLGGKTDHQVVVERLLAITGGDSLSVNRKNKDHWTGQLETRFMVLTNELPKLADASGALASRFLILLLTNSFYGKEDLGLTARIVRELPGILNWSLDGWQRLQVRGHFVQPAASAAAQHDFEDLGSPIGAFIRDRCNVAPFATCRPEALYYAWCDWCREQNISQVGTVQMFGRDLRAAVGTLKIINPRVNGVPERHYQGIEPKAR